MPAKANGAPALEPNEDSGEEQTAARLLEKYHESRTEESPACTEITEASPHDGNSSETA